MFPLLGNAADGLNAAISAARGNYGDAAIDGASAIPGAGQVAGLGNIGVKFSRGGAKILGGVKPNKLKTALSANAGEDGVVYLRRDQDGGEYVGQAKSEQRYKKRQQEHSDANPDSEFEFEELERVSPNSDRTLDVAEEDWIRAGGGPTNKSNPDGGLQNKRHQMSDKRYEENDGSVF